MYPYTPSQGLEQHPENFNGGSHILSEWFIQAVAREMTKPHEMTAQALSWRRLHLAKAKLKASSRTSALLSGFAMVAMVEVQLSEKIPQALLIAFSICTTLLVAIHMLALMISTCILPHIEAVSSVHMGAVSDSPHEKMRLYIETAWAFSTVFGILLFLSEIAILCWVKFYDYSTSAALAATILLIPLVIVFVSFAIHFYNTLVAHKYEKSAHDIEELERMMSQLQTESNDLTPNGPAVHIV